MFKLLSQREKIFLMVIAVLILVIRTMTFDNKETIKVKEIATTTPMVLTDISNSLKERVKQEAINIEIKVWEINQAKE